MQSIERQDIRPQIRFYIKEENPAERIAGLFYYSSAAMLWTAGTLGFAAFLIGVFFSPEATLIFVLLGLIFGLPGWVWAGAGVWLFLCHKRRFNSEMGKNGAVATWILTIAYNGVQALFIFYNLSDFGFGNVVGGWNLIVAALSVFALYFELKKA